MFIRSIIGRRSPTYQVILYAGWLAPQHGPMIQSRIPIELITSGLATNVVRHAGTPPRRPSCCDSTPGGYGAVYDDDASPPVLADPSASVSDVDLSGMLIGGPPHSASRSNSRPGNGRKWRFSGRELDLAC